MLVDCVRDLVSRPPVPEPRGRTAAAHHEAAAQSSTSAAPLSRRWLRHGWPRFATEGPRKKRAWQWSEALRGRKVLRAISTLRVLVTAAGLGVVLRGTASLGCSVMDSNRSALRLGGGVHTSSRTCSKVRSSPARASHGSCPFAQGLPEAGADQERRPGRPAGPTMLFSRHRSSSATRLTWSSLQVTLPRMPFGIYSRARMISSW